MYFSRKCADFTLIVVLFNVNAFEIKYLESLECV